MHYSDGYYIGEYMNGYREGTGTLIYGDGD